MVEDAKPFACSVPGCNRQFTVEDHLTVHKQKHSMLLNLNGAKNADVADQTPTPTRFIKTCEEVGLFQDLQNPFEETFRKAAEAAKTGTTLSECGLGIPSLSNCDDTLHTPHIFPTEDPLPLIKKQRLYRDPEPSSTTADFIRQESTETTTPPQIVLTTPSTQDINNMPVLIKLTNGKFFSETTDKINKVCTITPDSSTATLIEPKPLDRLSLAKQKLKETLTRQANGETRILVRTALSINQSSSTSENLTKDKSPTNEEESNEPLKKYRLERNRAAAMRCRQKRKRWICELESRANHLQSINNVLQTELLALRTELSEVKTILLQHRDCPVTQSMIKNGLPSGMHLASRQVVVIPNSTTTIIHQPTTSNIRQTTTSGHKNIAINPSLKRKLLEPIESKLESRTTNTPVQNPSVSNPATVLVPLALVQPPRAVAATQVIKLNPFVKRKPSLELRLPERKNS